MLPEIIEISTFWSKVPFEESKLVNTKYFREISSKSTKAYRGRLFNVFEKKLFENVKIMKVHGGTKIQEIKESNDLKIIPYISSDQIGYYCSIEEYETVKSLHYRYMGDNFETHYLQANKYYDSGKEGVFHESIFMKTVGKWYFKIGFPIFLLFFLKALFKTRPKCPECGSQDFHEKDRDLYSEYYQYEKKNGERDLRYKDNPLIQEWKLSMECNNCSYAWLKTATFELASGEKTLKRSPSNRKRGNRKKRLANKPQISSN